MTNCLQGDGRIKLDTDDLCLDKPKHSKDKHRDTYVLIWSEPDKQVRCEYFVYLGFGIWAVTPFPTFFWIHSLGSTLRISFFLKYNPVFFLFHYIGNSFSDFTFLLQAHNDTKHVTKKLQCFIFLCPFKHLKCRAFDWLPWKLQWSQPADIQVFSPRLEFLAWLLVLDTLSRPE